MARFGSRNPLLQASRRDRRHHGRQVPQDNLVSAVAMAQNVTRSTHDSHVHSTFPDAPEGLQGRYAIGGDRPTNSHLEGIHFAPATDYAPELLVRRGTAHPPRAVRHGNRKDIDFGWRIAKELGRLDIGQSVAVKDQAVLAAEAIEGTDQCIRRAGSLCKAGGFTVIKVAKPQQDMRFDVPTIGRGTLQTMLEAGGRVLAVEAHRTISTRRIRD